MNSVRFESALVYACVIHAGHVRKGTRIPYISHLLSVAAIALEHGATDDEAIAALLHDAVEDAGGPARLADIRQRFGDKVARIVEGCTDADEIPKPPWEERKKAYLKHLVRTTASVRLVSAADKLHNARAILADYRVHGDALWERFRGKRLGTFNYYRRLAAIFNQSAKKEKRLKPLADEISRVVAELEREGGFG